MQQTTPQHTTSFDIIKATAEGYKFLWNRRKFIARLALLPVVVKFICFFTVINLDLESNLLRQGILFLPYFLLEGYLVCTLLRFAVYSKEEVIQPPGSGAFEYYKQRGRDIQAGAIMYTLIKLLTTLFFAIMLSTAPAPLEEELVAEQPEVTFEAFFAMLVVFIALIWAFRLMWLNIPLTLGYNMKTYLRRVRGMSFSFHIFSVWVMCVIPFGIVVDLLSASPANHPETGVLAIRYAILGVQAVLDTMMVIVSHVGIALGIYWVMTGKNIEKKDMKK